MSIALKNTLLKITVFTVLLFLASCKSKISHISTETPAQTHTIRYQLTSTPSPEKTTSSPFQVTPTIRKPYEYTSPKFMDALNSIRENYYSLPYSQYVLFEMDNNLFAITPDGKQTYNIGSTFTGEPITTDGRILQIDFAYNGLGKTINLLNGTINNDNLIGQISPNEKWIAKKGGNSPYFEYAIQLTNIESAETMSLPLGFFSNEQAELFMSEVQWSKDGKFLQYMIIPIISVFPREEPLDPTQPMFGIYQMDTDCLSDIKTCTDHITKIANLHEEMHFESSLEFSPDNSLAVVNMGWKFIVINLQTHDRYTLSNTSPTLYSFHFAISPDNQWMAYSGDGTNILMQSIHQGDANTIAADLNHVTVLGWLTAPYLQPGDSFKVLSAGDHVYIRENADLDSEQLTYLISGNTFTVLDGPIQEDGYTWWYIHSDVDGTEGWISEFYGWYKKIE